jgi:hypothetical protein
MRCSICNARFPHEVSVPNHICLDGKLNGCSCTAPAVPATVPTWTTTPPREPGDMAQTEARPHLAARREMSAPMQIAALYVARGGCYFGLDGVDPWDEERDARTYAGPWPIVAHPPCHLWTNLSAVNFKRYGGEHNRPGNDGGCFTAALSSVRRWGGVLEHPASSRAYSANGLPRPTFGAWQRCSCGGWTTEVWQSAYGHRARKRTWLYYYGDTAPPSLLWSRNPGTCQCGWFDRNKPTLGKREASATPLEFRDLLISMARSAA